VCEFLSHPDEKNFLDDYVPNILRNYFGELAKEEPMFKEKEEQKLT
jgi:hypothetical protein